LIEEPLIEVGEIKINTIKEGREFAKKIIEEALGVKAKLAVDSEMSVDNFKTRLQELKKLFGEYEINSPTENEITLRFTSGERTLGFVKRNIKRTIQGFTSKILTINVGSKTDPDAINNKRAFLTETGRIKFSEGNKVDPENLEKLVTTHEFAHVITTFDAAKYNNNIKQLQYWDDLKKINVQYNKEVLDLLKNKDVQGLNKIYAGKYADTNIDEFHAELFMEYKLTANPTKYAKLVGELIDKTFKK
jgi:hypothetical protein